MYVNQTVFYLLFVMQQKHIVVHKYLFTMNSTSIISFNLNTLTHTHTCL